MELTVDPADFNLLAEHHALGVDGEFSEDLRTRTRQLMQAKGVPQGTEWTGLSPVTDAPLNPPADLLALVGKPCETCRGSGREFVNGELAGVNPERDRCQDCHGTGSALLTVTTDVCPSCLGESALVSVLRCDDCDDYGTRSLLVRLTGQPVQVVGEHYYTPNTHAVEVTDQGLTFLHHADDGAMQMKRIDLGPDPARLIGRWVWLPDALEVVG